MRDISLLSAEFRPKAIELIKRLETDILWHSQGYRPLILETLRDLSTQMAYYSRSRMRYADVKVMFKAAKLWDITEAEAEKASTWTLASKHIEGKAIDIAPSKDGINPDWKADLSLWRKIGYHASDLGLDWGGDWKNRDNPHVEMRT